MTRLLSKRPHLCRIIRALFRLAHLFQLRQLNLEQSQRLLGADSSICRCVRGKALILTRGIVPPILIWDGPWFMIALVAMVE